MKHTFIATVAALGLFAAGATFTSMNHAARPDQHVAQISDSIGGVHMAAAENDHQNRSQYAAAENDHASRIRLAAAENDHQNRSQYAAAENDHQDHSLTA